MERQKNHAESKLVDGENRVVSLQENKVFLTARLDDAIAQLTEAHVRNISLKLPHYLYTNYWHHIILFTQSQVISSSTGGCQITDSVMTVL